MKKNILTLILLTAFFAVGLPQLFANEDAIEKGKKIALTKSLGNCLSCHKIVGANQPGDLGPELINMKTRYPDKKDIRSHIWDATQFNKISAMPPFGRNQILTEEQIDYLTEFVYSL